MSYRLLMRQTLLGVFTALGATTLVFIFMRVIPGDPAEIILGDWGDVVSEEHIAVIRTSLGIDKPLWQQYALFLESVLRGEFGVSFRTGEAVSTMVASRFPLTLQLAISGLIFAVLIGLPIGILAAVYQNSWIDRLAILLVNIGLSAPAFWVGLLLLYFFAFRLNWFPLFGAQQSESPWQLAHALVLPAITIGFRSAALLARVSRSSMLEVLNTNYITTARAKGLYETTVILRHGLRNAGLPIVTLMGVSVASLLGGSVIVEVVFSRPGMGRLLVDGIFARDYPVVQGTILIFAIFVVAVNFFVDLLYGVIDPRVRTE